MSFDTVYIECPSCDSFIPITTYKGECIESEYSLEEAPLILVAEIHEESKAGRIQCTTCGTYIAIVVKFLAFEKELSDQQKSNRKW